MQNSVVQQNVPQQSNYQPQANNSAQYQTVPMQAQQPAQPPQQPQIQQPQNQNVQVPNYSGVNIQIFKNI